MLYIRCGIIIVVVWHMISCFALFAMFSLSMESFREGKSAIGDLNDFFSGLLFVAGKNTLLARVA